MNSGLIDFQVSAADVSLHGTLCTKVQDSTFPLGTICLHFWSHGSTNMSNMGGSYQYLSKHGSRSTKESSGVEKEMDVVPGKRWLLYSLRLKFKQRLL